MWKLYMIVLFEQLLVVLNHEFFAKEVFFKKKMEITID